MKLFNHSTSTALVLALVLLTACVSGPLGTGTNTYSADQAGKRDEFIGDRDLAQKFVLVDIKSETRDGRLRVQFDLKNTTPGDLPVEWAMEWRDRNGFLIDTNPHWQSIRVTGQGFHSIQATGPTTDAAVWKILLRKPTPIR